MQHGYISIIVRFVEERRLAREENFLRNTKNERREREPEREKKREREISFGRRNLFISACGWNASGFSERAERETSIINTLFVSERSRAMS